MSLFIGIDSGTQSVKAIVLDLETRKVVAEARAPHSLIEGLPVGHMEQHPHEWVAAMDFVIKEVVAALYTDTPDGLLEMAGRQVHAHLLKLKAEGKVTGASAKSAWSKV